MSADIKLRTPEEAVAELKQMFASLAVMRKIHNELELLEEAKKVDCKTLEFEFTI
jgi:hypothetical protein